MNPGKLEIRFSVTAYRTYSDYRDFTFANSSQVLSFRSRVLGPWVANLSEQLRGLPARSRAAPGLPHRGDDLWHDANRRASSTDWAYSDSGPMPSQAHFLHPHPAVVFGARWAAADIEHSGAGRVVLLRSRCNEVASRKLAP